MRDYLQSTLCIKRFHSRGQLCKLIGTKGSVISRWSMIVSVIVVLKRTNVDSDWHSDTLCGSHLQSQRELYQVSRWHETLAIDLIGQLSRDVIGRLSVKPSCYWLWRLLNVIGVFQTVFMSQLNSRFLLFRSSVIQSLCRKCSHKKKYLNSHKICLEHQHGHSFIVLPKNQYGRRDVMWKRSITGAFWQIRIELTCSSGEDWSETSL